MSAICVSVVFLQSGHGTQRPGGLHRSIYQDVPLYDLEEFKRLAPEGARNEHVLADEHQLMLNRLSFELAERQRCVAFLVTPISNPNAAIHSLDLRKKDLIQQKEDLLKESKSKLTTMDSVKTQIELLMRVCVHFRISFTFDSHSLLSSSPDSIRHPEEGG